MQKKVPMRKCIGCNEQKTKKELVRFVRSPEGDISLDLVGKKSGRGAYICPSAECLKKARNQKGSIRFLKCRCLNRFMTKQKGCLRGID